MLTLSKCGGRLLQVFLVFAKCCWNEQQVSGDADVEHVLWRIGAGACWCLWLIGALSSSYACMQCVT